MASPHPKQNAASRPRLTVLFVGYRRRPFTTYAKPFVSAHTIAQRVGINRYSDRIDGKAKSPYHVPSIWRDDTCCHLRFFAAVRTGSREFLQLHDEDTVALMWFQDDARGKVLASEYLAPENEIKPNDPVADLATRVGMEAAQWTADGSAIHLLAVLVEGKPPKVDLGALPPPIKIKLDFADLLFHLKDCPPQATYSTSFDLWHHHFSWEDNAPCFDLLDVLDPAASSLDCSFASLPDFKHIVVTRWLCPWHRQSRLPKLEQPSTKRTKPATLQQLVETASIKALLHSDPPQFVDAVDCVVDGALYNADTRVMESVRCFIVFDHGLCDMPVLYDSDHFVNQAMLDAMDFCSTIADPSRSRLLLIVTHQTEGKAKRINRSCFPTAFPTISVDMGDVFASDCGILKHPFAVYGYIKTYPPTTRGIFNH